MVSFGWDYSLQSHTTLGTQSAELYRTGLHQIPGFVAELGNFHRRQIVHTAAHTAPDMAVGRGVAVVAILRSRQPQPERRSLIDHLPQHTVHRGAADGGVVADFPKVLDKQGLI